MSIAVEISIQGHNPVREVIEECAEAGWPIGTPIKATGCFRSVGLIDGEEVYQRGVWHYIWLGNDVRSPCELEQYLFRS